MPTLPTTQALGLLRLREVGQDDDAVALHGTAVVQDVLGVDERRELLDDVARRHLGGPVEHDAERALGVMGEHEHDAALEVRDRRARGSAISSWPARLAGVSLTRGPARGLRACRPGERDERAADLRARRQRAARAGRRGAARSGASGRSAGAGRGDDVLEVGHRARRTRTRTRGCAGRRAAPVSAIVARMSTPSSASSRSSCPGRSSRPWAPTTRQHRRAARRGCAPDGGAGRRVRERHHSRGVYSPDTRLPCDPHVRVAFRQIAGHPRRPALARRAQPGGHRSRHARDPPRAARGRRQLPRRQDVRRRGARARGRARTCCRA